MSVVSFMSFFVDIVDNRTWFEPAHEIMVLFFLRKPIFQTRMRSHPVWLDVLILVGPFTYFHTSCLRTATALAKLGGCAGLSSLVAYVISTMISKAGSIKEFRANRKTNICSWNGNEQDTNLSNGYNTHKGRRCQNVGQSVHFGQA